jgi:hypothetical protein
MAAGIILGGCALIGVGMANTSSSASADVLCFDNLVGNVTSPDGTAHFQIGPDGTGLSFSLTGNRSATSLVLHFTDGTKQSMAWKSGLRSATDLHSEPRKTIAAYDVCKDELATGAPTTTTTTTEAPATVAPTTVETVVPEQVTTTTTTTTIVAVPSTPPSSAASAPVTITPSVEPTVFTRPQPALPATGQNLMGLELTAGGSMVLGGFLLLAARRQPVAE